MDIRIDFIYCAVSKKGIVHNIVMKPLIGVFLAIALVTTFACTRKTEDGSSGNNGPGTAGQKGVYPHSEIFKRTNDHGKAYLANPTQCASCHGTVTDNNTSKVISCSKCHGSFPHPPNDWVAATNHGQEAMKNVSSCYTCHGDQGKGKGKIVGCKDCHDFPHGSAWSVPEKHGKSFLDQFHGSGEATGGLNCAHCHSGNTTDREKPIFACDKCHTLIPHTDEFKYGGHSMEAGTYGGKCLICHSSSDGLNKNMPELESCTSCHDGSIQIKWHSPNGASRSKDWLKRHVQKLKEEKRKPSTATKDDKKKNKQ